MIVDTEMAPTARTLWATEGWGPVPVISNSSCFWLPEKRLLEKAWPPVFAPSFLPCLHGDNVIPHLLGRMLGS